MLACGGRANLFAKGEFIVIRRGISTTMENQTEKKVYLHYNHTDSCKFARWNARECYEFMYARPWQQVNDFYSNLVNNGSLSLSSALFGDKERPFPMEKCINNAIEDYKETEMIGVHNKGKTGRWDRVTFKILLAYHGNSFDGWQKQPGLNTVQGIVETSVGSFVDEIKAQKLKDKGLPLEGCTVVAGRTDKGVTALKQVCSFYTWRKDVEVRDVEDSINQAAPGKLRAVSVSKVSREFHPNFTAKWRHYFYIFPLNDEREELCSKLGVEDENYDNNGQHQKWINGSDGEYLAHDDDEFENGRKPRNFSVEKVNQLLLQLQGRSLSYKMFARDTKASRSTGPPTECIIYHARATEASLPRDNQVPGEDGKRLKVMCVELVANRFLRRMVRVLVATAMREAAAGADSNSLLKLLDATCRRATAPPAPPDGLCLVDVGYLEFNPEICLIP